MLDDEMIDFLEKYSKQEKAKAEKLQKYIKKQNDNGQKLFGGIVIEIEKSDGWRINQKPVYDWNKCEQKDWSDWKKLEF